MPLFFQQGQNPIANFLGDNSQDQASPYNNSSNLMGLGLGLLSGKTPQEQVGNAASSYYNSRQAGNIQNKTVQFLKTANPQLAQAVESGAISPTDAYKLHFAAQAKAEKPLSFQTLQDGTYGTFDASNGTFNPLGKAVKPPGSGPDGQGNFGLQPVWATDAAGKYHLIQPGKDGTSNEMKFADGLTPMPGVTMNDTGTGYQAADRKTGLPVGNAIPKDNVTAAAQKEAGTSQGKAMFNLPVIESHSQSALKTINDLQNDAYLPNMLGPVNSRLPNMSADSARVQGEMDQLKGQNFLSAFDELRGAGAITDTEGDKATDAKARLATAQNKDDYNAALNDLKGVIQRGLEVARQQAAGSGVQPQQGGLLPPASGAPAGGAPTMRKFNPATGKIE